MSLYTRTASETDQVEELLNQFVSSSHTPLSARKDAADSINALLSRIQPSVDKLVAKAEAGERDPNKRIYGASMVSKIFALRDRFSKLSTEFTPRYEALNEEWKGQEEQQRAEEERKRIEEERSREEQKRLEAERIETERKEEEDRLRMQKEKEEAERREKEEAARRKEEEERREAERKKLDEERIEAEKKRHEEEEAAALKKKQAEERAASVGSKNNSGSQGAEETKTISITIKTTRGGTFSLKAISPTATVAEVKDEVERNHGISKAAQRLIFQGRLLVDTNTIDSYKISNGSAVHLVENARAVAASSSTSAATKPEKWIVAPGTVCHLQNGKQQFDEILSECGSRRLVVVDWFAPWCGPCRMISPVFQRLATRFSDVTFITVDTEASPGNAQLAAENQISAYPTFHFILNHVVKFAFSGANASTIESNIKTYRAMVTSKDSSSQSAASSSTSRGNLGPIATRVMASLTALHSNLPMSDFIIAVRTLLTFVQNIVANPGMEKYRKVRTGNSTFQTRLGSKRGGMDCMRAFGFKDMTENGDNFLVISAEAAEDPELRTVMSQLQSALDSAAGNSSTPTNTNTANTPGGRPLDTQFRSLERDLAGALGGDGQGGMGGMPGMPGMAGGAATYGAMAELMHDPSFQQIARDVASDPEAFSVIMEAQQAFSNGDMATVQRLQQHPAMIRLQSAMTSNPAVLNVIMRQMAERGFPGMGTATMGMGGAGMGTGAPGAGMGIPGMGGADNGAAGTGLGTGGQAGTGDGGQPNPVPPAYPGAPTTAEEEERLLQEAIRLSMQDQTQSKPDERREDSDDSQDKQT